MNKFAPLLKQCISSARTRHYIRFLVVGVINTIFGYSCYAAAIGLLHLSLTVALLVSQIAGILFNFQSYGRLVFGAPRRADAPRFTRNKFFVFTRFLIAYAITYGINLGVLKFMVAQGISAYLAQALALFIVVPTSYLILRFCVWRG